MLQLNPKETFVIARGISDPSDSSTYYVQAVIRNAKTDALLDTVNLTDRTGGRFSKIWEVPADTSGLGFYITITTRVYTDSGYSVLSDYMQETATYLIQERVNAFLGSGGGSGPDIDYKRIASIFKDALTKAFSSMPKPSPVDLKPVLSLLKSVKQSVEEIEIPEPKEVNLSALEDGVKRTLEAVEAIKIPEPQSLDSIIDVIEEGQRTHESEVKEIVDEMRDVLIELGDTMAGYISNAAKRFDAISQIHGLLKNLGSFMPENESLDKPEDDSDKKDEEKVDPAKSLFEKRPWLAPPSKEIK